MSNETLKKCVESGITKININSDIQESWSLEVKKYLQENGAKLVSMVRFEVGEGMEKRQENFAEEVMSQING